MNTDRGGASACDVRPTSFLEEHMVPGEKLVMRVKQLLHEGNVRRVIVKNEDGAVIMELPLTIGVAGAVLLPFWVALGGIAALAAHYKVGIERVGTKPRRPAVPEQFHDRPDF